MERFYVLTNKKQIECKSERDAQITAESYRRLGFGAIIEKQQSVFSELMCERA